MKREVLHTHSNIDVLLFQHSKAGNPNNVWEGGFMCFHVLVMSKCKMRNDELIKGAIKGETVHVSPDMASALKLPFPLGFAITIGETE